MQIHTPTVVQGRGGGLMGPLSRVFDMLQYFETILPKWRAFDQDEVYFISASATRGL